MHPGTLIIQAHYIGLTFQANTANVTHDDSLWVPDSGGNCINWIVGHLVGARSSLLHMVGESRLVDKSASEPIYGRGAPALNPAQATDFQQLVDLFSDSQEPLAAALGRLTDHQAAQPAPFSPAGNPEETVGSLAAGLIFHESYHVGQLGVLRRLVGKEGALS